MASFDLTVPPHLGEVVCPAHFRTCTILYQDLFTFSYFYKGWGQNAKLGPHSAIWGKLGTALQAYALNPCTKFHPNPTSRKVNT